MYISYSSFISILLKLNFWNTFFASSTATLLQRTPVQSSSHWTTSSPQSSSLQNGTQGNTSCASRLGQRSGQISKAPAPAWPWQVYKSALFNPPELEITTNGLPLAPGLLFIAPSDTSSKNISKENAVLIMTDAGELVWNGPEIVANNFRVASYQGKDILTYWTGASNSKLNIGHGYGSVTFLDTSYNEILVVCTQLGLVTPDNSTYSSEADLHESFVTDRDTILVSAYNITRADLSSIGGPSSGWVYDCLFFEIEPRSGKILFSWSALEHVSVTNTKQPLAGAGHNQSQPFDYFHINSVVNIGDTYLVNSRHTWSVYQVTSTGEVALTLQGETGGDFGPLPPNGHFVSSTKQTYFPHSHSSIHITINFTTPFDFSPFKTNHKKTKKN